MFVFTGSTGAAKKHFRHSVEAGIPLADLMPAIKDAGFRDELERSFPDGRAYCWAGRSGGQDERYWNQMAQGDLILGYQSKGIRCVSHFMAKRRSRALANAAWPDTKEDPYDLVYFFSQPVFPSRSRPLSEMSKYFGKSYQGLRAVRGSEQAIKDYGSLTKFASAILLQEPASADPVGTEWDIELAGQGASTVEGRRVLRQHLARERDQDLIRRVKVYWVARDRDLRCTCCGFSFRQVYGEIGDRFIEAHHRTPISRANPMGTTTRPEDLVAVCANCHRMLHRNGGMSVEQLQTLLRGSLATAQ
jgi:5-methylcytosine-specific restriction endonuclease McrA